jgi:dipeptidyl aminopeptidase/acylaminoacyl peptidase
MMKLSRVKSFLLLIGIVGLTAIDSSGQLPGQLKGPAVQTLSGPGPSLTPLPVREGLSSLTFAPRNLAVHPRNPELVAYQTWDDLRREERSEKYSNYVTASGVPVRGNGSDIWLVNSRSGEARNLTEKKGSNWGPVWSPDGRFLAFYSNRDGRIGVWVWEQSLKRMRRVTDVEPGPFMILLKTLEWTPDSRQLLVKIFPKNRTREQFLAMPDENSVSKPGAIRLDVYESKPKAQRDEPKLPNRALGVMPAEKLLEFASDLALIDVSTGAVTRIATGFVPAEFWLSPQGDKVAFLNAKKPSASETFLVYDLIVASLKDRGSQVVASDVVQNSLLNAVSWSPQGDWLAYQTFNDETRREWDLGLVSADGRTTRKTGDNQAHFTGWPDPPLWSPDGNWLYINSTDALWKISSQNGAVTEVGKLPGKTIQRIVRRFGGQFWSPDKGRSLVVISRDAQTRGTGLTEIDLVTGASALVYEFQGETNLDLTVGAEGLSEIYSVMEDASSPSDLWAIEAAPGQATGLAPRRMTHLNPVFDEHLLGQSRVIEWRGGDGERLRGALLLPAGYQQNKQYPLIVHVYGGDRLSERVGRFGFTTSPIMNMHFWTTRGYAVLLPDAPLRVGTPMTDLARTVLPGVDKLVEMGIADPQRLAVWGASYGGYSTLALLVQTNRFKAAVCDAGIGSLLTMYGFMPDDSAGRTGWQEWMEARAGRMGGTPWQHRSRYVENSPLFYLDRVETPLLIIQGAKDPGAKDMFSNEIFMSMQRLGKEATYLKYTNGSHTITSFSHEEKVDVLNRMIDWFDKHLKATGKAEGSKQ